MAATAADDLLRELLVMETTLEKVARRLEEEFAERFQGSTVRSSLEPFAGNLS
jgi:hypothetical protein